MVRPAGFLLALIVATGLPATASISIQSPNAGTYMDSVRAEILREVSRAIFREDFDAVDSLRLAYIRHDSADPVVPMITGMKMMAQMSIAEEDLYGEAYHALFDSVRAVASALMSPVDSNRMSWMYLWRGHAKAYQALHRARFGSQLKAFNLIRDAVRDYERGLEFDSTIIDHYVGLGTYHYWKSAKAGILRWFGILKNEIDKGLAELHRAAAESYVSREGARSSLIYVLINEKQTDSALAIALDMYEHYPEGRTFLWPLAEIYYQDTLVDPAIKTWTELRTHVAADPGNYFNLLECDWHLADLYRLGEDMTNLRAILATYLTYRDLIPERTRDRQEDTIHDLNRWVDRYDVRSPEPLPVAETDTTD